MRLIAVVLLLIHFVYTPNIYTQEQLYKSNQIHWEYDQSAIFPEQLKLVPNKYINEFAVRLPRNNKFQKSAHYLKMDN